MCLRGEYQKFKKKKNWPDSKIALAMGVFFFLEQLRNYLEDLFLINTFGVKKYGMHGF